MTTPLKRKLCAKIAVATALMRLCLLASGGPLLYAIYRIVASSHQPERGFEGMGILLMLFTQGMVLLFPLIGFVYTLGWRRSLQHQLQQLERDGGRPPC